MRQIFQTFLLEHRMRRFWFDRPSFAGIFLMAVLTSCGVATPLPTEPDACEADLALMAGSWTGMAGEVWLSMALAPGKYQDTFFGLPVTHNVMTGAGLADHPEDHRDVAVSFRFICSLGLSSWVEAAVPPPTEGGPPTGQVYAVARIEVLSVSSTHLVALLRPAIPSMNRPYPFDTQVQVQFLRPPT